MSDRIIVHVGMHKTGSSSIQDSLAKNLKANRMAYLQFGHPNGSNAIQGAYGALERESPRNATPLSRERALELRSQSMVKITSAFNALKRETAIVSAEAISTLQPHHLAAMFDLFSRYRSDVSVVAYIRRPKSYLESVFQERLKVQRVPLEQFHMLLQYRAIFSKFDKIVGEENVQLHDFDRSRLHANCVVLDFCHRNGIPLRSADVVTTNEGLSAPAIRLLYAYRRKYPVFKSSDVNLVEKLAELEGHKLRFHSSLTSQLLVVPRAQLAWINKRVGRDMSENFTQHDDDDCIRGEQDLAPTEQDIEWLAQKSGVAASKLSTDLDLVAATVAGLAEPAEV